MAPAIFFLAGIPAGVALFWLIGAINSRYEELPAEEQVEGSVRIRRLPWQRGAWPGRVRAALAALLPVCMATAAARFDVPQAMAISVVVAAFLTCTGTDLLRHIVPDVITYPGTALALFLALVMPGGDVVSALIGAALFGLTFLVIWLIARGGFGLGDVKLAVLMGASLGLAGTYAALLIGVFAGGLFMVALLLLGVVSRKQGVPYAPFLALAAVGVVLFQGAVFAPL